MKINLHEPFIFKSQDNDEIISFSEIRFILVSKNPNIEIKGRHINIFKDLDYKLYTRNEANEKICIDDSSGFDRIIYYNINNRIENNMLCIKVLFVNNMLCIKVLFVNNISYFLNIEHTGEYTLEVKQTFRK